jgi:uncharacterized membrane protein YebE (DUF533 family)
MTWSRYFVHDYYTARELDRVDRQMRNLRRADSTARVQTNHNMEQLEDDLGRAYLMIAALTEACVRGGHISRDELAAIMDEIDLADGKRDGKVTLEREEDQTTPQSTNDFLRQLEGRES